MVIVRDAETKCGTKFTSFEVPLPNAPAVFMSVKRNLANNENRGVVIVDSAKFLELWKINPLEHHPELSHGNRETWIKDKKYHEAAEGFAEGSENPVPLANVACDSVERTLVTYKFFRFGRHENKEQYRYAVITNGYTRTIFLLSHGCKAFPVECGMSTARYLHQLAAAPWTDLRTVDELITQ